MAIFSKIHCILPEEYVIFVNNIFLYSLIDGTLRYMVDKRQRNSLELTILMPCLNEEMTIVNCIDKAKKFLSSNKIDGEILVSDNGSTDHSASLAKSAGARVIMAPVKGYGGALIEGCKEAMGKYVIMGDADDSYDFLNLMPIVEKLREGYDLVIGDRFAGGIEKGAMPWSHKYIGNPILSFIGRLFYHSNIRDFHCGLRGYNKESIEGLHLHTTGMEYASEMIVKAELMGLKIAEVPTTLKKDGRSCAPHLRSFRDGWRHLKFLFMFAPKWLFFYPGMTLCLIGILGSLLLIAGQFAIGGVFFSIHTLLYCMMSIIIGVTVVYFYVFTKVYSAMIGFIPKDKTMERIVHFNEDRWIVAGVILTFVGIALTISAFLSWCSSGFGDMIPEQLMRKVLPAVTLIEVGIETVFASFFVGILKLEINQENLESKGK